MRNSACKEITAGKRITVSDIIAAGKKTTADKRANACKRMAALGLGLLLAFLQPGLRAWADPVVAVAGDTAGYGPAVVSSAAASSGASASASSTAAFSGTFSGTSVSGTAQGNISAGSGDLTAYGPGVANTDLTDAALSPSTLLKTDDPVKLYVNETAGLGGAEILMLKGTQEAQQLCLVIETAEGKRIVIDGGSRDNADYLYRYLCENGGYVDAWFVTHPHQDHVGALTVYLTDAEHYPLDIRKIYCSTGIFDYLRVNEQEVRVTVLNQFAAALDSFDQTRLVRSMPAGTEIALGGAIVRVLNEPFECVDAERTNFGNNASVCYRITLGDKRFLVLGDLAYDGANKLLTQVSAADLKADILQLAHHGQHGGCPELYAAIAPVTALWSCPASVWSRIHDRIDPTDSTYKPQVTYRWMQNLGVARNYSMSCGNWLLK